MMEAKQARATVLLGPSLADIWTSAITHVNGQINFISQTNSYFKM